jgi:hypothetical protein
MTKTTRAIGGAIDITIADIMRGAYLGRHHSASEAGKGNLYGGFR